MNAVDPQCHGSASAMIATNRQVAMSIGLALSGIIFSARQIAYYDLFRHGGDETTLALRQAIPSAFGELMLVSFFLSLTVLVFSLMSPKKKSP